MWGHMDSMETPIHNNVYKSQSFLYKMQAERVNICARKMLTRGCAAVWFIPLVNDATVDDVLKSFAQYMATQECEAFRAYPLLRDMFDTLLQTPEDCMFVFCRRGDNRAAGILRSTAPLCSARERALMQAIGAGQTCDLPLWTWTELHPTLARSMERQCRLRDLKGHCMGVWCYR